MMKQSLILLAMLAIPLRLFGIMPPSAKNTMPDHLRIQAEAMRREYTQGYWYQRTEQRRILREQLAMGMQLTPSVLHPDSAYVPVLLGRYSDSFERFPPVAFQQLLFDGPNPSGTVTQFYLDNSYGQLYFTGRAEGWYAAPRTFDYYVHDGGSRNAGLVYGGADFTIDILARADSTIDFSRYIKYYDAQGRGHVPQLGIVHTGADAAAGAANIWSHRSSIRNRLLVRKRAGSDPYFDVNRVTPEGWYITNDLTSTGNAVLIDGDYAIEPELLGSSNTGTTLIEIGVFAHEFGHIFGLPDLYDTDNSSEGLGNWCVMAAGSYGADGAHEAYPANFSAWCKERMGWVTPIIVSAFVKQQTIHNVEDYPEIYKLWRLGASGNQYFLVENRQRVKSDRYLLNTGLLIFHVDNTQPGNMNENHYLVDLEQADGNRDLNRKVNRGDAGDPYPGTFNNHAFEGSTNPNSNDYLNAATYVGVRNISNSGMTMTADLDVGTRPYVVVTSLTAMKSGGGTDSRVEPGDAGDLRIQLNNEYPTPGSNLQLSVQSVTQGAAADTSVPFSIGDLSGVTITLHNALHVAPSFTPREATFDIAIASSQDTLHTTSTLVLGFPALLFVDRDSTNENILRYYRTAADNFGTFYETFRTQGTSFSAAAFERRKTVVWLTGRTRTGTVPDSAQKGLTDFVNSGGNLLITGQNVAEDLQLSGNQFLSQVLHARWSKNITLGRTLLGDPSDPLGVQMPKLVISGGNGASNQTSPDELAPDSVAHRSLYYSSLAGSSIAGVWYEHPTSHAKMLFFGFGFEAINDSSTGISRQQVMTAVLNWFNGVTSTPNDGLLSAGPASFSLEQNFPNPFNPTTAIRYQVPGISRIRLAVYDLLGREVATLVNEMKRPGTYTAQFDGKGLASGVYFYRLQVGNASSGSSGIFGETKKFLLLK